MDFIILGATLDENMLIRSKAVDMLCGICAENQNCFVSLHRVYIILKFQLFNLYCWLYCPSCKEPDHNISVK